MFLTKEQLEEITGETDPVKQTFFLRDLGLRLVINPHCKVLVHKGNLPYIMEKLRQRSQVTHKEERKPDVPPDLSQWFTGDKIRNRALRSEEGRYKDPRQKSPLWANKEQIKEVYIECARIQNETGIKHHVDHIVPIQGKMVSGLHVAENLRIITATENLRKSNRFEV